MELIDSHCHLYLDAFSEDIGQVIERARRAGVGRFYLPAIDREHEAALFGLEAAWPGVCFAMQGLHPCSVKSDVDEALRYIEPWFSKRKLAAVGECGLDFYWDKTFEKEQFRAFRRQIEWASQYDLPIVIHSRNSIHQTIAVISEHQKGNLRGVFHCFNEDEDSAKKIMDLGFFMGIGGPLTYKKSTLPDLIKKIGLQQIVLETDAPYLPPVPYRGKRNESSYLVHVAEKLAEILSLDVAEVARITTDNSKSLFRDP
jgi:TatD DNase family protein